VEEEESRGKRKGGVARVEKALKKKNVGLISSDPDRRMAV